MHDRLDLGHDDNRTVIELPLEVKADGTPGTFEGYGAIFGNTDRDGDVVERGAFTESLKARTPALLWQHNAKEPIGRFDVVREDERGLYVKGRLSMSGRGAEAYELLKLGALNGLSIGFVTKEAMRNRATGTRTIKRAELMEVSLVTFPANELARVQTVKGNSMTHLADEIETPRAFERMLREAGFSRSRAKAITAKGFRGAFVDSLDEDLDAPELGKLVTKLRDSQGRLQLKAAPVVAAIAVRAIAGIISGIVIEVIKGSLQERLVNKAIKALVRYDTQSRRFRSNQVITLRPGEEKTVSLRVNHDSRHREFSVVPEHPEASSFKADLSILRWSSAGPHRESRNVSGNADGRLPERKRVPVGDKQDIRSWLTSIGGKNIVRETLSEGDVNQAERLIFDQGIPTVKIRYAKHEDPANREPAKFLISLR